jgi:hypothetical protein
MDSKSSYIKDKRLSDQFDTLRNMAFNSAVLAEGTNDATIKTQTNTFPYMVDGKLASKAPADNIAVDICAIQPVANRCRYLISVDVGGTVHVTMGTSVRSATYAAITTLAWVKEQQRLVDSAKGLTQFKTGDKILISGFTDRRNNGIFTVRYQDTAGGFIQVVENGMVDEIEGDAVTLVVESPLPDLPDETCPIGYLIFTTGTTDFQVGVDDLTDDKGTGSFSFVNVAAMPSDSLS